MIRYGNSTDFILKDFSHIPVDLKATEKHMNADMTNYLSNRI